MTDETFVPLASDAPLTPAPPESLFTTSLAKGEMRPAFSDLLEQEIRKQQAALPPDARLRLSLGVTTVGGEVGLAARFGRTLDAGAYVGRTWATGGWVAGARANVTLF